MKRISLLSLCLLSLLLVLSACGAGDGSSKPELKLDGLDQSTGAFSFVDTRSGETLTYERLVVFGQPVVDTIVMTAPAPSVLFAFDNETINRTDTGFTVNGGTALTIHGSWPYTLEEDTLNILDQGRK